MHSSIRSLVCALGLLVAALVFLTPDTAHARRRGFVLITTGETIAHVEDLPADSAQVARETVGSDVKVGYAYSYFGAFWLDLWTYEGRFCLYSGDEYWELDDELAQDMLGKPVAELSKPLRYRFPPLLVLIVLGAALYGGSRILAGRREAALHARLVTDPTYRQAAEIYANAEPDQAFESALTYLEEHGIDRDTGYDNLVYVLHRRGLA